MLVSCLESQEGAQAHEGSSALGLVLSWRQAGGECLPGKMPGWGGGKLKSS